MCREVKGTQHAPLRPVCCRLGAGLLAVDAASKRGLEPVDQSVLSEWSAGALASAQTLIGGLDVVVGEKGGPVGHEGEQRPTLGQPVGAVPEMTARARPGPLVRPSAEPGAHRVAFDIAGGGEEVRLVEDAGSEPPLPEIAAPALAQVDRTGIAPMGLAQAVGEPLGGVRHEDQMDVVGHQAPGPDRDA